MTTPETGKGEAGHRWPRILPDGGTVLFSIWTGGSFDLAPIGLVDLKTGARRTLAETGGYPVYVNGGYLVLFRGPAVVAAPFDSASGAVPRRPVQVLDGVRLSGAAGGAHYSVSAAGSLAYIPGGIAGQGAPAWVDRQGISRPASQVKRSFMYPSLSPDGGRVAMSSREASSQDIWVLDLARDGLTRLTFESPIAGSPVWTPDGRRIAYRRSHGGAQNLYWKPADGSGPEERLTTSPHYQNPTSFSPDGKWLAFWDSDPATSVDIWLLALEGERKPRPFLQTPAVERHAMFSPDGRWIAYTSFESGRSEVYVMRFPEGPGGGKWPVSTDGGDEPVWARHGRELFYRQGDRMMAVDVTLSPAFSAGKPRTLFQRRLETVPQYRSYDVSPDGRSFLVLVGSENAPEPTQINLVLNWSEELRRKVGAGR